MERYAKANGKEGKIPFGYLTEFIQNLTLEKVLKEFTPGDSVMCHVSNIIYDYQDLKDAILALKSRGFGIGVYAILKKPKDQQED